MQSKRGETAKYMACETMSPNAKSSSVYRSELENEVWELLN